MEISDVDTIAVLGAGTMGHGIAELAALAGYDVHLQDVSRELVQKGYEHIEWSLEKLTNSGQLEEDAATAAFDRITTFTELNPAVEDVDVVIEAIPEEIELKNELFAEVEIAAPDRTIFASNTSTLSITDLSEATDRPEQVCGMHFFNPPVRMQLVEVISGSHTADETLDLVEGLASTLDKTPIRVQKDVPGFVVNRVLVPMLNEAAWIVETETGTIAEVDSTAKHDLRLPMGCFELADQIGIDVAVDVLEYMHEGLGRGYEPCPLFLEQVETGNYGQKTGEGFYNYEEEGVNISSGTESDEIAVRLVGIAVNETAKLVANDVATADDIDEAVILGAGFEKGPTALAADIGFGGVYEALVDLFDKTGAKRYEPSSQLAEWAEAGGLNIAKSNPNDGIEFETIRLEYPREGVAHIILNRPENLNSINDTMLDELDDVLDTIEMDSSVSILLTGEGTTAFCGGADLQFMGDGLEPLKAVSFSRKGQRVFGRLMEISMPVIVGVDGFCLGGGMELATCADLCIAGENAEFGQPELNLGILPAWGGTQRLRYIVGERRAREIILTADHYDAETMHEYGFVNEVVNDEELTDRALELAAKLAEGAPLAQRALKNAMLVGQNDIEAGLQTESDAFGLLWTTQDTVEGIDAFHDSRTPEFEGK